MLKEKAPPRVGKGGHKVVAITDRTPEELKPIIEQMRYRNMTATSLAAMLDISKAAFGNWTRGVTPVHRKDVYAIRYVLTHSYWDDELNEWVVID